MSITERQFEALMYTWHKMAVDACKDGKYKHNAFPPNAALYDENKLVRAGACLLIMGYHDAGGTLPLATLLILNGALKTEQEEIVRFMLREAIKTLEGEK